MSLLNFSFTTQEGRKKGTSLPEGAFVYTPINDPVGNSRSNAEDDVLSVRRGLDFLDYGTNEDQYPSIFTRALDGVIKNFQTAENLKVDGVLNPKGETEGRLQSRLQEKASLSPQILRDVDDERTLGMIRQEEGAKKHIYLDTKGNPTTGVGFLLPNVLAAQGLPFRKEKEGRPATTEEIAKAYHHVRMQPYGQNHDAGAYQYYTDIVLDEKDIDKRLKEILHDNVKEIRKKFPDFDNAPADVQLAVLDMQFNLGDTKFRPQYTDPQTGERKGWPSFFRAYQNKDWKEMARQSHRKDISAQRNQRIYDLLYDAR